MRDEVEKYCAEAAMKWYGWGSPVGLTIFLVGASLSAWILHKVITG